MSMAPTTDPKIQLLAGVAAVDITGTATEQIADPLYAAIDAEITNDRLCVKALVLRDEITSVVVITVDAVAIAEIGSISNDYLTNVRAQLHEELSIEPTQILINASHCHGVVCADVEQRTVQAVRQAWQSLVPVRVGVGVGHEDRIMENRRLGLESGRVADVRRAYSLPPDDEIESVGPVDPEIGILRLDREDDRTLAVVYNFACHPIQGVPGGGNTADLSGFATRVIEENLGDGGLALFLQGCGADINPIRYRDIDSPPDAEPLGHRLGLSTLRALKSIRSGQEGHLRLIHETVRLPRADLAPRIASMEAEQTRLLASLKQTMLNLKSFVPLLIKHRLSPDYPAYDSHRYLHERAVGRDHLRRLDATNNRHLDDYIDNVHTMEELTRLQVNLDLLRKHQARRTADGTGWIDAEVACLRVGDFVLVTFPGELPVEMGLRIKQASPHHHTFVAGVTNGYLYYTPTAEQLENRGGAQEDSDCLVDPSWQKQFEAKVEQILKRL